MSIWARLLSGFRNDLTLWRKPEGDFYALSLLAYLLKGVYLVEVNEHCSLDVWPQHRTVPRYRLV